MLTAKHKLEFKSGKRTAKRVVEAGGPADPQAPSPLPRITKMMALAIRFDHLIRSGQVTNQAELARVGHVTRARLTQIMDLNLLAPDIQEEILFLQCSQSVLPQVFERDLRHTARYPSWAKQRALWRATF